MKLRTHKSKAAYLRNILQVRGFLIVCHADFFANVGHIFQNRHAYCGDFYSTDLMCGDCLSASIAHCALTASTCCIRSGEFVCDSAGSRATSAVTAEIFAAFSMNAIILQCRSHSSQRASTSSEVSSPRRTSSRISAHNFCRRSFSLPIYAAEKILPAVSKASRKILRYSLFTSYHPFLSPCSQMRLRRSL